MTPTTNQQLEWLDLIKGLLHSDNAPMILAIKENLIAVRNMEVSIERELEQHGPKIDQAFKDLVDYGEARIDYPSMGMTPDKDILDFFQIIESVPMPIIMNREQEERIVTTIEHIEKFNEMNPDKPFILRGDYLNDREKMLVDRRIEKLNQQIKHEYSLPKLLRKPRFIETSFQTIATLKKWRNDPNQNP